MRQDRAKAGRQQNCYLKLNIFVVASQFFLFLKGINLSNSKHLKENEIATVKQQFHPQITE